MAQKKIDIIIDVVTDKANSALGGFKKSVADAEKAVERDTFKAVDVELTQRVGRF